MKSNWLLIAESNELSLSSQFYKIAIGTSKQEMKYWESIQKYAHDNGFYFEKWSDHVKDFVLRIADSLGVTMLDLNIPLCNAKEFVAYLVRFGCTPKNSIVSPNYSKMRSLLRPSAYFLGQINVLRHAEAIQRKKPKA